MSNHNLPGPLHPPAPPTAGSNSQTSLGDPWTHIQQDLWKKQGFHEAKEDLTKRLIYEAAYECLKKLLPQRVKDEDKHSISASIVAREEATIKAWRSAGSDAWEKAWDECWDKCWMNRRAEPISRGAQIKACMDDDRIAVGGLARNWLFRDEPSSLPPNFGSLVEQGLSGKRWGVGLVGSPQQARQTGKLNDNSSGINQASRKLPIWVSARDMAMELFWEQAWCNGVRGNSQAPRANVTNGQSKLSKLASGRGHPALASPARLLAWFRPSQRSGSAVHLAAIPDIEQKKAIEFKERLKTAAHDSMEYLKDQQWDKISGHVSPKSKDSFEETWEYAWQEAWDAAWTAVQTESEEISRAKGRQYGLRLEDKVSLDQTMLDKAKKIFEGATSDDVLERICAAIIQYDRLFGLHSHLFHSVHNDRVEITYLIHVKDELCLDNGALQNLPQGFINLARWIKSKRHPNPQPQTVSFSWLQHRLFSTELKTEDLQNAMAKVWRDTFLE